MKLLSAFLFLAGISLADPAFAAARCYRFSVPTPAREADAQPRSERWCYREVAGGTYIFNADGSEVRPELALLRSSGGTITQASLAAGRIRYVRLPVRQFNPLSVPLEEPRDRRAESVPVVESLRASPDAVLARLEAVPVTREEPGAETGPTAAAASYLPWRGYWWPLKGMPMLDPLRKFDAFVRAHGGNAGAAGWEASHHASHGVWWEGHCNGWAAAAILRPEPRAARVDDSSGQAFSVSQLKGIATEADYCAPAAFYGYRRVGSSGVSPQDFHQALLHYVGRLRKPIAFNLRSDGPIDNRVISGYAMNVVSSGDGYVVTTKLTYHDYDAAITDIPGVAPSRTMTYRYRLSLGANGDVTGGAWLSKRPGFVWVPLSTGGKCRGGNPNLGAADVTGILGR